MDVEDFHMLRSLLLLEFRRKCAAQELVKFEMRWKDVNDQLVKLCAQRIASHEIGFPIDI